MCRAAVCGSTRKTTLSLLGSRRHLIELKLVGAITYSAYDTDMFHRVSVQPLNRSRAIVLITTGYGNTTKQGLRKNTPLATYSLGQNSIPYFTKVPQRGCSLSTLDAHYGTTVMLTDKFLSPCQPERIPAARSTRIMPCAACTSLAAGHRHQVVQARESV